MNYYEHHLGDYAAATAHLTWDEDMAYTRLIRAYYHHEKPLPPDIKDVCRLARATSTSQRKALETVLREFFTLESDGWRQKRCDEEIARYNDKRNKAARSASARWNALPSDSESNANAMRTQCERIPNAVPTQCEGNAPSLQSPDTSLQTPVSKKKEERTKALAEARAVAGLDVVEFDRWVEYREKRKPAIKTISLVAAAREMAKLGPGQADAVRNSIANGYQGLVPPKGAKPPPVPGALPGGITWRPPADEEAN